MKVPNLEHAEVDERKLVEYLLSPDHQVGQGKARFLRAFGFTRDDWTLLADALRRHAATHEVTSTREREAGRLYVVEGVLETPDGRAPGVRTVWCIDHGTSHPRFITAYPLSGRRS